MISTSSFGVAPAGYRLPPEAALGPVRLQIADVSRSIAYYRDIVGLRALNVTAVGADLAAEDDHVLLSLQSSLGARPVPPNGTLGLFHVAILLPDRAALGQFVRHLATVGVQAGMSDHVVSEAVYLTDPDGLGLEIYADRPRAQWRAEHGQLEMGTDALDVRAVLAAANGAPWRGAPMGTRIGHVHLRVGDVTAAAEFYHNGLGFDKTVWNYPGALFLAAGGYHHHVGTNTWSRSATYPANADARLLEWTLLVPDKADVDALAHHLTARGIGLLRDGEAIVVEDPWGTCVRVRPLLH